MAKRKPFHGPRQASWEVFLDSRHVTITSSCESAHLQASEGYRDRRDARVFRTEYCPAPGCKGGVTFGKKGIGTCKQCDGAKPIETAEPVGAWFYVSCENRGDHRLVSGPYATHTDAMEAQTRVRRAAELVDPRAVWYAWGTCRSTVDQGPGILGVL